MSKKRLGKGLGALLPNDEPTTVMNDVTANIIELSVEKVEPNPFQPRREFDEELLKELRDSILEFGVLQPITVRKVNNIYQLVAGERRLRATIMAGLNTIPAIEKDVDDKQMMELALIENLQREDLNPIEEAVAYKKLMDHFQLTQEEVAKRVSKSRSAIANTIRLLNLPEEIQMLVSRETITMGHARALLSLADEEEMLRVCTKCIKEEMTVRQLEEYIKFLKPSSEKKLQKEKKHEKKNADVKFVEDVLRRKLGTIVKIDATEKKSKITIECSGLDELNRIVQMLKEV